ncbi:UDPGP type 1 family protein [candidate division KSB1 bacterium]|nr:MAG: UDPGP type 1 family protein [candidate division KSB1 bacterium]
MLREDNTQWQAVIDKVYQNGQGHIFKFWDQLTPQEKQTFIDQLARIDWAQMNRLIRKALNPEKKLELDIRPVDVITLKERIARDANVLPLGEQALRQGKVGVCLVAGGQGSRLGFDGPKGCFPITPVKNKSLFQLHAEKIKAMSLKYKVVLPWYIMTSRSNNQATIDFFEAHDYFDLGKENVFFFIQEMIPAIDHKGKFILEAKNRIFESPNGHGGVIKALWQSGAIADMKQRGIEYLFYFQVDNVLIKMCDPVFIGYHIDERSEMSNKVVRKVQPEDRVGVICKIGDKIGVVEYSDLDDEHMYARDENGDLKFWAGSIAIHVINVAFIERENKHGFKLPFHIAQKSIPYLDDQGNLVKPAEKNGYKFETFIFDALLDAQKTCSIEVKRSEEFSAVKNKEGFESPQTAKEDLMRNYAAWLKRAGIDVPMKDETLPLYPIEISPLFALDADDVKRKKDQIPPIEGPVYLG